MGKIYAIFIEICITWNLLLTLKVNKGNAKRGVSPRLKICPGDLDL